DKCRVYSGDPSRGPWICFLGASILILILCSSTHAIDVAIMMGAVLKDTLKLFIAEITLRFLSLFHHFHCRRMLLFFMGIRGRLESFFLRGRRPFAVFYEGGIPGVLGILSRFLVSNMLLDLSILVGLRFGSRLLVSFSPGE